MNCVGRARGRVRDARRALASLALGNNARTHETLAPAALELSASASAAGAADAAAAAAEELRRRRHAVTVAGAAGRDERDRHGDVAEARARRGAAVDTVSSTAAGTNEKSADMSVISNASAPFAALDAAGVVAMNLPCTFEQWVLFEEHSAHIRHDAPAASR